MVSAIDNEGVVTVLDRWALIITTEDAVLVEKRIRLLLQPKPWWLPTFLWHRLVARLIVIEERHV